MRIIDADKLPIITQFSDDGEYSWDYIPAYAIREAPTIDAVPVVRCKDCRWSRTNQKDDADVYYCELRTGRAYHSGDFCSYGERKAGEG